MSNRKELERHLKKHHDTFGEYADLIRKITDYMSQIFDREMVPDVYEGDSLEDEAVMLYFSIDQQHSLTVSLMEDKGQVEWFYKNYEDHYYTGIESSVTIPIGIQDIHKMMIKEGHIKADGPWKLGEDNGT